MSAFALFTPIRVGDVTLSHRVAMAPLTRFRANDDHVHTELALEYYRQRSSTPGTLIVTEATPIDARAGGYPNIPGIWNEDQVTAWKKITDAVHANGSFIFLQLWALGRTTNPEQLAAEAARVNADPATFPFVSAGDIPFDGHEKPRPLTQTEIQEYISWYGRAARLAVHEAGFDGVEIHGANGYLVDQFLQDVSNNRTDSYGGSIENRSRFALEAVQAAVDAVGASKVGIRLSPWERFQGMRMQDPVPQFSHLISTLAASNPTLAYIHLTEPRISGGGAEVTFESLDFARKLWAPRPFIVAGGFSPEDAYKAVDEAQAAGENLVVAFGRHFIANPDLPVRIQKRIALNPYNRDTFYAPKVAEGYTDYPFAAVA